VCFTFDITILHPNINVNKGRKLTCKRLHTEAARIPWNEYKSAVSSLECSQVKIIMVTSQAAQVMYGRHTAVGFALTERNKRINLHFYIITFQCTLFAFVNSNCRDHVNPTDSGDHCNFN